MFGAIYNSDANVDFRKWWPRALAFSAVLILISIGSFLVRGLNLGIDFEGGGVWEVPDETSSVGDVRDALRPLGKDDAKIQEVQGTDGRRIRVQAELAEIGPESAAVTEVLADEAGVEINEVSVNTVGPSWGDEVTRQTRNALIWFFVLIAIYIAVRLEWRMAVGALVAVTHDIIISVGVYSLFQFEITPATAIAFLTIMGYSLYDTIVVYDRVRENEARMPTRSHTTYRELMNRSMNQVLGRSINTTITSVLPVLSLLFVGSVLLGATTLQEFSIALLIGLLVGAYSSIFIAAPVLVWLKEREPRYRAAKERAERQGDDSLATPATVSESATGSDAGDPVIKPRGRKHRRR